MIPGTLMHRTLPILCLLLAACDRTDENARGAATAPESPARSGRVTGTRTPLQSQIAMAAKDATLQELREKFNQAPRDAGLFLKAADLISYYATHYPEAGLAWMRAQDDGLVREAFIAALYQAHPDLALQAIGEPMQVSEKRELMEVLCRKVTQEDSPRLWEILNGSKETKYMCSKFISGQARFDPDAAWQMWQEQFGGERGSYDFLRSLANCAPEVNFPAQLLDQVVPIIQNESAEQAKARVINDAIIRSRSSAQIEPIAEWLANQPPNPAYDHAYQRIASQRVYDLKPDDAVAWIERITDATRREAGLKALRQER